MKHFMDINRVKFDNDVSKGNIEGFKKGDFVCVQEKIDGSNASIMYDRRTQSLLCFSRKQELSFEKTLNGFWNYVQTLDPTDFEDSAGFVIFGEWMCHNHIKYTSDVYNRWIVYDIYCTETNEWLPQEFVKEFCEGHNLEYIHEIFNGKFTSFEDFINRFSEMTSAYCDVKAEGFIVKNQSNINSTDVRNPFVLKYVNGSYSEISVKNHINKVLDPQKEKERAECQEIVDMIVTKRRVEKQILKMQDESILPRDIQPSDMKLVAQMLPRLVYEDCIKEEKEYVEKAGQFFGKQCQTKTMAIAKEIILGK